MELLSYDSGLTINQIDELCYNLLLHLKNNNNEIKYKNIKYYIKELFKIKLPLLGENEKYRKILDSFNSIISLLPSNEYNILDYNYKFFYKNKILYTILFISTENCLINRKVEAIDCLFSIEFKQILDNFEIDITNIKINIILPFNNTFIEIDDIEDMIDMVNNIRSISGTTVDINKSFYKTVYENKDYKNPIQIFFGNPIYKNFYFNDEDIIKTKKLIKSHKIKAYVHGPFIFNLSNPSTRNISEMSKYFTVGSQSGFKGIIFHVGKSVKIPLNQALNQALNNMSNIIKECLEFATKKCPFLLETPAGAGTETLTNIDDFITFVKEMNDYSLDLYGESRFGICLDTAHVFSLDYLPVDYLNKILYDDNGDVSDISKLLKVIHFNDSKCCQGARKDRHAIIGEGYIPVSQFIQIINIVNEFKIDLVKEEPREDIF